MAARAIWKGIITFGMVGIPVKVYSATSSKDISFRQLHGECKSRIREHKFCPTCDRKVEYAEITKGYEYGKDQYVIIEKDDLEKMPLPNKGSIDISTFVVSDEIDPSHYEKTYYIEPEDAARKPFALFMKAVTDKNVLAIGKIALRSKERLCCLRPLEGNLVMNTLLYPDEIRIERDKPLPDVDISDQEMAMACNLVDMMTDEFKPEQYTDNYREALLQLIEAKVEGKEIEEAPAPTDGKVVDLMQALQASMDTLKTEKSKEKKAPAKKSAAKVASGPKTGSTKTAKKRKTG